MLQPSNLPSPSRSRNHSPVAGRNTPILLLPAPFQSPATGMSPCFPKDRMQRSPSQPFHFSLPLRSKYQRLPLLPVAEDEYRPRSSTPDPSQSPTIGTKTEPRVGILFFFHGLIHESVLHPLFVAVILRFNCHSCVVVLNTPMLEGRCSNVATHDVLPFATTTPPAQLRSPLHPVKAEPRAGAARRTTRVVLRAAPALGSAFTGWSGDRNCAGGVVVANGNTSCVATFEQRPSSIGVFKTTTHEWQLKRNITATNNGCNTDSCINPWKKKSIPTLGSVLVPIVGDLDGSGVDDLGLYSSSATGNKGSRWYLDRNGNEKWNGCDGDRCIRSFGKQGDIPVAGDWNGAGRSKIGVFRPATGEWFLDLDGDGRLDGCSIDRCIASFGQQGDLAVAGDWDAAGTSKIGLFRPSTGEWFLDRNGNGIWDGCNVDQCVTAFGQPGDLPVAGDWDATGSTKIGVFRPKTGDWFLDLNGNGQWDGCNVDKCLSGFGQERDLPVAGRW